MMMLSSVLRVLSAGLVLLGTAPAPKTWIADLKAKQATLGQAEVRVEGDVVDIRSTSPTAKFGFYRLIDASDPVGLLVRTSKLPKDGGALRLRGRLAAQQPADGSLLLDEVERSRVDRRPIAPLALEAASLLSLIVLAALVIRAAMEERRYKLSPPLWLLPEAGPYGKALAPPGSPTPPLKYSPELEDADRRRREQLRRRKRNLFKGMVGSMATAGLSGAWLLVSQPASAQVPAFIFIQANDLPIPISRPPETMRDTTLIQAGPIPLDSVIAPMRRTFRDTAAAQRPISIAGAVRPQDSAPAQRPPLVSAPPPPPPPAPAPPPLSAPVPVPDTAVEARRPVGDPEAERALATQALEAAATRLVDAINNHRVTELALLLPEAIAGDLDRREHFMKLVRESSPRGTLGTVEGTALAEDRGEARFTVELSWRGTFGEGHRKAGRFLGFVRRGAVGTGWRFEGARLLDPLP